MERSNKWRRKVASWVMLCSLLIPLSTVAGTVGLETLDQSNAVLAHTKGGGGKSSGGGHKTKKSGGGHKTKGSGSKNSGGKKDKGGKNSGGSKDGNNGQGSGASSTPASNQDQSSTEPKGNILDQPAFDLAADAQKDMTSEDGFLGEGDDSSSSDSSSSKKSSDKGSKKGSDSGSDSDSSDKDDNKASLKTVQLGARGSFNVGKAWSFMASNNQGIWSLDSQDNSSFNVATTDGDSNDDSNMSHFPSQEGKDAYHAMAASVHLAYIMNELGLDNSYSQGFTGQKHNIFMITGAHIMEICYGLTKFVDASFQWVLHMMNAFNPFEMVLQKASGDTAHFGPIADMLRELYDKGKTFGGTMMVLIFGTGIGLAAMGLQVGQMAKTSQARGMMASAIDLFKRAFVIFALPLVLATCYTSLLQCSSSLFENAGFAPGNYAIYSTMTSFEDMVSHGRLNFNNRLLGAGLLPNQAGKITSSRMTNAYLNHRSTLSINADFGRSGASDLQSATSGTDTGSTKNMFTADTGKADGQSSAMDMLKDYTANRTFSASDYVSQILSAIKSKSKDDDDKQQDDSQQSDLTDLKSKIYSDNGCLVATNDHFRIDGNIGYTDPQAGGGVQGNSTVSSASDLAVRNGGLSTIGMYNYLRTVADQSTIDISSPYKHNNQVSNPKHYSANFVGSGAMVYCNMMFALSMMVSMAAIALGTIWFLIKALIDSIPGSFSGIIAGAMGSLTGGVRAVGALLGFFISLAVTGVFYQLSFRAVVAFIGALESWFGSNTTSGDVLMNGAVKLFGAPASSPAGVAGLITLNSETFSALVLGEALMMLYIVSILFKWRAALIQSMSALANTAFSRIMQSFGAVTGRGSEGMANSGMMEMAKQSGQAGIGQMYNGAKNAMATAGRAMNMLPGGKNGTAGKLAKGLATAGATGFAGGAALKGLSNVLSNNHKSGDNNNKSMKNANNSKDSKKSNAESKPMSAEDAREAAVLDNLQAQQGDPLNFSNPMANGSQQQSMKGDKQAQEARKNGQSSMDMMDSRYSDEGHLQNLSYNNGANSTNANSQSIGAASQSQNPMANYSSEMQANAAMGQEDPSAALDQVLAATGMADPMNTGNTGINTMNSTGMNSKQMQRQRKGAGRVGQVAAGQVAASQMAGQMGQNPMADMSTNNAMNVANGSDMSTNPAMMTDDAVQNGQALDGADITQNMGDPMTDTSNESPMTNSQANQVAKGMNKVLGTNVSGQDVQQLAPVAGQMLDQSINSLDSMMSGSDTGTTTGVGAAGGTTITATGNGQAQISQSPGINANQSYGMGLGVMPGAVPSGMVIDPSYTTSGAGVINGGLNTALGNVKTASTQVTQANNAVRANPTNTILQQRATQALQGQRQAQVQAMQMFNSTPARQTVGSLINTNTPSSVSTGAVNQAISEVYAKQQGFKQAATRFGPTAPQTQNAASDYQNAINTARQVHIKTQILNRPEYLSKAMQEVRKQQMSIMDGTFKL